jgi:hypothetical protein
MGSLFATVVTRCSAHHPAGWDIFLDDSQLGWRDSPGVARGLPDVPEILFSCNRHAPGFPSGLAVDEVSR